MKRFPAWIAWLAALLAVAAAAVLVPLWLAVSPRPSGERFVTRISVQEGSVYLYKRNADGTKRFLRFLMEGQSTEVSGQSYRLSPALEGIKPLIARSVRLFLDQVDELATRHRTDAQFRRFYTQQEFNERIARRLVNARLVESLRLSIDRGGFEGAVEIGQGPVSVRIAGGGILEADESRTGELRLRVYWAKIGPVPLPALVLRQFERSFAEARAHSGHPLQIIAMDYQEGGIWITCRRQPIRKEDA